MMAKPSPKFAPEKSHDRATVSDLSPLPMKPLSPTIIALALGLVGVREKPGAERIAILGLVQVTTAEPVSYAKSRPCFERGMARDAVASATRDAGDIRCEAWDSPRFFLVSGCWLKMPNAPKR